MPSVLSRRGFSRLCGLLATFLVLALGVITPFPAAAAEAAPIRLRFANFPAASTFPCVSMERWADEVEQRTKGAVSVETFPAGTLLDARNMMRGVMQGQADIGCTSLAYHPGAFPMLSAFELPLGFASAEQASAAFYDFQARRKPKELSRFKVLAVFTSAPSQIMSVKPVPGREALTGLRLRAAGMTAEAVRAIGASAVSMPQSETPEALQKGVVDGVFSSLDVMQDYNFAEYCRHVLVADMPLYPFIIYMNLDAWNKLPAEVRAVMEDMGREHSVWTGRYVDAHATESLAWSVSTYDVSVTELSPEEKKRVLRDMAPVTEIWKEKAADKGLDAEAVLAEIMRDKQRVEGERK